MTASIFKSTGSKADYALLRARLLDARRCECAAALRGRREGAAFFFPPPSVSTLLRSASMRLTTLLAVSRFGASIFSPLDLRLMRSLRASS